MRIRFLQLAAPAALAVVCSTAAVAQGGGASGNMQPPTPVPGTTGAPGNTGEGSTSMQALDTDRDGALNASEASANPQLRARFSTLDRNRDGSLDSAEFARFEMGGATGGTPGASTGTTGGGGIGGTSTTPGTSGSTGTPGTDAGTDRSGTTDRSR